MTNQLTYDVTVTIEAYLNEALKEYDKDIFLAEKYPKRFRNISLIKEDREALREALAQVSEYGSYIANHGTL